MALGSISLLPVCIFVQLLSFVSPFYEKNSQIALVHFRVIRYVLPNGGIFLILMHYRNYSIKCCGAYLFLECLGGAIIEGGDYSREALINEFDREEQKLF